MNLSGPIKIETEKPKRLAPVFLTVDVEEWFHGALDPTGTRNDLTRRAEVATQNFLDLCDAISLRATFFVLGDVALHNPQLAPAIIARGHELGVHGFTHRFVEWLGPARFRSELRDSRALLEDQTGMQVCFYRAPYFSLLPQADFAFDILAEEGFSIDSSIFPGLAPRYGQPRAEPLPHQVRPGLLEVPVSVLRIGPLRLPFAGGAWFRLWPLPVITAAIDRLTERRHPVILYIHPWELDSSQPRISTGDWWNDRKHYHGRTRALDRFTRLMRGRSTELLSSLLASESPVSPDRLDLMGGKT